MKQTEKSKITYERILKGAMHEFGTKTYDNASINNICSDNNISKGLIYHNFKNKDELYLCCVKKCFDELTKLLGSTEYAYYNNINDKIKKLLNLRYEFFDENPYYSNIFFNSVLQPPKHLVEKIKQLKSEFDDFNISLYQAALDNVTLKEGITKAEAMEYFLIFQEMFNGYFQCKAYKNSDFNSLIEAHELKLPKVLNIMLYGIAKEE